jgi:hypothetical protein
MEVVRLGAYCELRWSSGRSADFDVEEYAVLADGRRVEIGSGRGFTSRVSSFGGRVSDRRVDFWTHTTRESLETSVRTTVLPDEDDGEDHPWEWLAAQLREQGVDVSSEQLKTVPYEVVFGERVLARVAAADSPTR